jgi:hypothetical protein
MIKKVLLGIFLLVLAAVIFLFYFAWRSPEYYPAAAECKFNMPPMTMAEYDSVSQTHPRPFIIDIDASQKDPKWGKVLFYGAAHTRDKNDPQISDIEKRWESFKPTVCLVEGRLGFLIPGLMDPVQKYGEGGLVYKLSRRDGVEAYTWEQPLDDEITAVLKKFKPEQTAMFYILRPYFSNIRFSKPENPDEYVKGFIEKRTQHPELQNTIKSVGDIDAIWNREFRGNDKIGEPIKDWRETSDEYGLPLWLGDISAESNFVRNEYLACLIITLVKQGKRVFVIGGSSHPVCIERTLNAELK